MRAGGRSKGRRSLGRGARDESAGHRRTKIAKVLASAERSDYRVLEAGVEGFSLAAGVA